VDCFDAPILRADFHFTVKTVTDLENPFSHFMRFGKAQAFQFRRFAPSIIPEATERYSAVLHKTPPKELDAFLPREFPSIRLRDFSG
jgi:hypothetical protein